jgi:hypothetical protein
MANKRTALDILFQEIKESKSFLPDNLFDYLEMVYNKAKEIETKQIKDAWLYGQTNGATICTPNDYEPEEIYYNETYKQQDNG